MRKVVFYSTHCPQCKVLEQMLQRKNVQYEECNDTEEMDRLGIRAVPQLGVDDKILNFQEAMQWVRNEVE